MYKKEKKLSDQELLQQTVTCAEPSCCLTEKKAAESCEQSET